MGRLFLCFKKYDYIILLYIIKTRNNVHSTWFIFGKMRPFLKQKSVLKI